MKSIKDAGLGLSSRLKQGRNLRELSQALFISDKALRNLI